MLPSLPGEEGSRPRQLRQSWRYPRRDALVVKAVMTSMLAVAPSHIIYAGEGTAATIQIETA